MLEMAHKLIIIGNDNFKSLNERERVINLILRKPEIIKVISYKFKPFEGRCSLFLEFMMRARTEHDINKFITNLQIEFADLT